MSVFAWLAAPTVGTGHTFKVLEVAEARPFDGEIKAAVADELVRARISDELRNELRARVRNPKYAKMLEAAIPSGERTRKGDFGEIVSGALMEAHLGYVLPARKLRYKIRSNDQQTGIDIIGFKVDHDNGKIIEVCYTESKFRSGTDRRIAVVAHQQLRTAFLNDLGEINLFIANVLKERRDPLFPHFLTYLDADDAPEAFIIGLQTDSATYHPDTVDNLDTVKPLLDPLTVLLFKVPDLNDVVKQCFDHAGILLVEDDE